MKKVIVIRYGELWLKDYITVGEINGNYAAGISGVDKKDTAVRFWAGSTYLKREEAPFRVLQDGTFWATQANITGNIEAITITANKGNIGGWLINEDSLSSSNIVLQAANKEKEQKAAIIVGDSSSEENNYVVITDDGKLTANGATINGTIKATGGSIGNLQIVDIENAMQRTTIEISSSNGNITKYNQEFKTIFTVVIKKGGIEITDYNKYSYQWQYSDDGTEWNDSTGNTSRTWSYSATHTGQKFIRCLVEEVKE